MIVPDNVESWTVGNLVLKGGDTVPAQYEELAPEGWATPAPAPKAPKATMQGESS